MPILEIMKQFLFPLVHLVVACFVIFIPAKTNAAAKQTIQLDTLQAGSILPIVITSIDYSRWEVDGAEAATRFLTVNYKDGTDPVCYYGATLPSSCFPFFNGVTCKVTLPGGITRTFYQGSPGVCTQVYYQY